MKSQFSFYRFKQNLPINKMSKQCNGQNNGGTIQCRRMVIGSDFCWQHKSQALTYNQSTESKTKKDKKLDKDLINESINDEEKNTEDDNEKNEPDVIGIVEDDNEKNEPDVIDIVEDEAANCCICMEPVSHTEIQHIISSNLLTKQCHSHIEYHLECLKQWTKRECPICRAPHNISIYKEEEYKHVPSIDDIPTELIDEDLRARAQQHIDLQYVLPFHVLIDGQVVYIN